MGHRHLAAMGREDIVDEVVTVDPNPAVAAQYLSIAAALIDHDFDFGVVASPTTFHEENTLTLLEAGVPILIEKPLADSVAAANRIAQIASKRGCKVAVGHIERFNPAVVALLEDMSEKPLSVTLKRVSPYPSRITDVGVALDLSIHDVDLARYITGAQVVDTKTVLQSTRNNCEDLAMYLLELDSGASALVQTNWVSPYRERTAEVTTEAAVYKVDMLRQQTTKYTNTADASYGVTSLFIKREDQLGAQLKAFIEYVLTGTSKNLCLLNDGIEALTIVEESLK